MSVNRREFMRAAALSAAGVVLSPELAAAELAQDAQTKESAPAPELELREHMGRTEGEAVLQKMARSAMPKVRTAAYGRSKKEGGWFFGESQKPNAMPNFRLYAVNFEDTFLSDLDELSLYRVGPALLHKNARAYEQAVAEVVRSKDLIPSETWLPYLPDFSHDDWAECELLTNAHFAFKMQGAARSVIVTPFGQLEFRIQPAATLWAEFHAQFEIAKREIEAVREYGEAYATELARVDFDDLRNPLDHAHANLVSLQGLADLRGEADAGGLQTADERLVLSAALQRLTNAQKDFTVRFKKPIEEFDIQKEELIGRARDGHYENFEHLLTAVQQLYGTIEVDLNFKPASDMLPLKKRKVA